MSDAINTEISPEELVQQLPVDTFIQMKCLMFSTQLVTYLKCKVKKGVDTNINELHEQGQSVCQQLIDADMADELLIDLFEQQFNREFFRIKLMRQRVKKKFTKILINSGLIETIPVAEIKQPLAQLAEISSVKDSWMTENETGALSKTIDQLYDTCREELSQYLDPSFANQQ